MKKYFFIFVFLMIPLFASSEDARSPEVKIFKKNLEQAASFSAFPDYNQAGGSIAVGDLGKDGKAEIVIGSGPGQEPWVYIYRSDGQLKRKFLAYDQNSQMGVNVAIGNVRGKKKGKTVRNEIIVAPMYGGGPQIRVFNNKGNLLYNSSFFVFEENFKGGVNIAACDTNGNGRDEIIAASGSGTRSHVRSFDSRGNYLGLDYYPFASSNIGGVTVACANADGGSEEEIVMGIQSFGKALVKVYKTNAEKNILGEFYPFGEEFYGGVQVAGGDIDNDGYDEVIAAPTQTGGPHIRVYEGHGEFSNVQFMAYEDHYRGGLKIASGYLATKKNKADRIAVMPANNEIQGRNDKYKYIDVNLSEQRLRAYKNGKEDITFLVSTGRGGYETPTGEFNIYAKFETLRMTGFYGEDHPENYDLENVPHVLAYYGDYTIHGAYWHNNLGHVMSHGCVNEPLYEAGILYDWAENGDPVIVHY